MLAALVGQGLRGPIRDDWLRAFATSGLVTLPITALVLCAMIFMLGHRHGFFSKVTLSIILQVFVIAMFVELLRTLARRPSKPVVELRTIVAPPLPSAEEAFRKRLSARFRSARLIAIEAHDHYVRVHTDLGAELITARFADAMDDLSGVYGFRVHRSWWVAGSAIKSARWERAHGALELEGGLAVPISRSGAPLLRSAGWL
jgi:DNA-binding LytR/AlgR family response regulator